MDTSLVVSLDDDYAWYFGVKILHYLQNGTMGHFVCSIFIMRSDTRRDPCNAIRLESLYKAQFAVGGHVVV